MACPTEKTMREIPLGISLVEQDNGFILRRKLANGEITTINLTEEEFLGLKGASGLLVPSYFLAAAGSLVRIRTHDGLPSRRFAYCRTPCERQFC